MDAIARPKEGIHSTEIDQSEFSSANLAALKTLFPEEADETLARFLISQKNDLEKAKDVLTAHITWRAAQWPVLQIDIIEELKKGKATVFGTDASGHPVVYYRMRSAVAGEERNVEEHARMIIWWMDVAISQLPLNLSKISFVFDRVGCEDSFADIDALKALFEVLSKNYPERLHKAIIYPAGMLFYGAWNAVKWLLDSRTREKCHMLSEPAEVLTHITAENLPTEMGGSATIDWDLDNMPSDPYHTDDIIRAWERKALQMEAEAEAEAGRA